MFNAMFEYENGNMKMNTDIDMNNKRLMNLANPINDDDGVSEGFISSLNSYSQSFGSINSSRVFAISNVEFYFTSTIFINQIHIIHNVKDSSRTDN